MTGIKRKWRDMDELEREEMSLCLHIPPLSLHFISLSPFPLSLSPFPPFPRSQAAAGCDSLFCSDGDDNAANNYEEFLQAATSLVPLI